MLADPSRWQSLLDVNLLGPVHGLRAFLPAMQAAAEPGTHHPQTADLKTQDIDSGGCGRGWVQV